MKIRVRYAKGDKVRFLSHLDLARNIRMALKRAKWPVAMTQGYSPKMKVSFYAPLPVGTSGEEEYLDVTLDRAGLEAFVQSQVAQSGRVSGLSSSTEILAKLKCALSSVLPKGFSVHNVFLVPHGDEPFESQIQGSLYRVKIETEEVASQSLSSSIEAFLTQEQVLFEVQRPKKTRTMDLREFVEEICFEPGLYPFTLFMRIRHDNGRTARPQWVVESLSRFGTDIDTGEVIVNRLKLYFE